MTESAARASRCFWAPYALGDNRGFPPSPRVIWRMTMRSPSLRCLMSTAPAVSSMSPACAPMARIVLGDAVDGCAQESRDTETAAAIANNGLAYRSLIELKCRWLQVRAQSTPRPLRHAIPVRSHSPVAEHQRALAA